jgi:Lactonase, 7-bladed beta-propeller
MKRRSKTFGATVGSLVLVLLLCAAPGPEASSETKPAKKDTLVYAGTSKGIYLFRLQTEDLEVSQNITLVPLGLAAETPNPSFIYDGPNSAAEIGINPSGKYLYASNRGNENRCAF